MPTKVLIVDIHAEMYRDRCGRNFLRCKFKLFHNATAVSGRSRPTST